MTQFLFSSDRPAKRCEISECGNYRYLLEEGAPPVKPLVWIMLNPSTADAYVDDPTIRKVRGFTKRFGFERWVVVNLFAFRSKDPKECARLYASNPAHAVGAKNDALLWNAITAYEDIVCAWGAQPWASKRMIEVIDIFGRRNKRPLCLGISNKAFPLHPLMQPYSRQLVTFGEWS